VPSLLLLDLQLICNPKGCRIGKEGYIIVTCTTAINQAGAQPLINQQPYSTKRHGLTLGA
jgi:hypothetical protein